VFVQIADLNDNAPSFNVTHYEMSVAENMPKYSFVGKVQLSFLVVVVIFDVLHMLLNFSSIFCSIPCSIARIMLII